MEDGIIQLDVTTQILDDIIPSRLPPQGKSSKMDLGYSGISENDPKLKWITTFTRGNTITVNPFTYEETCDDKCEYELIVDTVIVTYDSPPFTLYIKAYRVKHESLIYWYVGCDILQAMLALNIKPSYKPRNFFCGIVVDNDLTRMILKYLCMSDDELSKYSGRNQPIEYRSSLIKTLNDLCD